MKIHLLSVLTASLAFGLACSGGAPTTEAPPPPPPPADGSIGVQECDDYIKKVEDCLGKLPAEAKGSVETSLKANRDAWAQAAATPQGKSALGTGCKMALDAFTCPDMGAMGTPPGTPGTPTDGTATADGTKPADGTAADGTKPADGTATGTSSDVKTETNTSTTRTETRTEVRPGTGTHDPKNLDSMRRSRSGGDDSRSGSGKRDGGKHDGGSSGSGADKTRHR